MASESGLGNPNYGAKEFLGQSDSGNTERGTESLNPLDSGEASGEKSKTNINNDPYDRLVFDSLLEHSENLSELSEEGEEDYAPFPSLLQDLFDVFYKRSPELVEEQTVDEDHLKNRVYLKEILNDEQTGKTRANTRFDEMISATTTISTGKKLLEIIREQQDGGGSGDQPGQEESGQGDLDQKGLDQGGLDQEAKNDLQQALSEAAQESEEMADAAANWGLEDAELRNVPVSDRFRFARALSNKRMRYLANLVGKATNLLSSSKVEKIRGGNEEIEEISFGGDLSKVLAQELVLLRHKKRKKEFLRRYADNQLLSYEMLSNERQNRGPLVILVDTSGSMMSDNRIDGAIATSLALVNVAVRKQRRRAVVKFFNTDVRSSYTFSPSNIPQMIRNLESISQIGTSGGTNFYGPITKGLEECRGRFKKADLLLLTDGQCDLSKDQIYQVMSEKKQKRVSLYTVLFEEGVRYNSLNEFSDEIYEAKNLIDDADVVRKLGANIRS